MREKSGRNAMNASKLLLAAAFLTLSSGAQAQIVSTDVSGMVPRVQPSALPPKLTEPPPPPKVYAAPPLFLLKEVFIDYPTMTDPKVSSDCGLTRESMLTTLQRNLQDPSLDVMALTATHPREGIRIKLAVEVMTVKQGKNCISWLDMPFIDTAAIVLPPVKVPRSMTLVFWQQKKVVSSTDERHQPTVNDMLASMVRQFLRDVKLAVPNAMLEESQELDDDEREKIERNAERMKALNESVSQKLIMDQQAPEVPLVSGPDKKTPENPTASDKKNP